MALWMLVFSGMIMIYRDAFICPGAHVILVPQQELYFHESCAAFLNDMSSLNVGSQHVTTSLRMFSVFSRSLFFFFYAQRSLGPWKT